MAKRNYEKRNSPEDIYKEASKLKEKSLHYEEGPAQIQVIKMYSASAKEFARRGDFYEAKQVLKEARRFTSDPKLKEIIREKIEKLKKSSEKKRGLEKKFVFAILSIISLASALFFSASSLTGYSISGLTDESFRFGGVILFFFGLVFAFFYFKNKK